jgi:hypothetical protein
MTEQGWRPFPDPTTVDPFLIAGWSIRPALGEGTADGKRERLEPASCTCSSASRVDGSAREPTGRAWRDPTDGSARESTGGASRVPAGEPSRWLGAGGLRIDGLDWTAPDRREVVSFWSRDDEWIWFETNLPDGWRNDRVSADGQRSEVDLIPGASMVRESPAGDLLCYVKGASTGRSRKAGGCCTAIAPRGGSIRGCAWLPAEVPIRACPQTVRTSCSTFARWKAIRSSWRTFGDQTKQLARASMERKRAASQARGNSLTERCGS